VISELRENLINNKEFLDSLKLEKNDLQSKFNKLQKELDAMKSEVSNKRASVMPKRISVGAGGGSALDFFSSQNADYSPADFRQIREVNEEEEIQQDDLEPKVNQEVKVAERPFDSLMSSRFSYQPGNERFSIFDPVRAAQEEVTNDFSAAQNVKQSVDNNTETFGPSEDVRRKPTTAIDFRQLSQDYLGLKQTGLIKKILEKNKETQNDNICFSDYMYRINTRERREHRVLFITSEALYSLHPRKGYNVIRRVPLEKIYRITVSKSSAGLCAIHVYNDYDYLIDIYKRLNLILFLQNVFRYKGLKQFAIVYEQSFLVKNRNATTLKQIDQYSKAVANPELQSTYKNAQKFGELYVKSWGLFTTWTLYFFILTEVGFVCFSKAGSSKPVDFIPILGYLIIDKGTTADGKYAFKIKFPHSDFEITLAADSDIEKKDWIRKIKILQENAEK